MFQKCSTAQTGRAAEINGYKIIKETHIMRLFSKTRRDFLKLVGTGAASWFVGGCTESHLTSTDKVNNKRPNVVLVMTDDQGYGDLSCTGNPIVKTPNIDTLYARSVWRTST
jgi:hypothetical protein